MEELDYEIALGDFRKITEGRIEVKSAYNGKILCKDFDGRKHKNLCGRKIISIWSEIRATKSEGFSNIARPTICVFVSGKEEFEEDLRHGKFGSIGE